MSSTAPTIRQPKAVLCDAKGVAALLGSDVTAVLRELDAGRLPWPLLVCGQELWRIAELRDWVVAGCPDRAAWERRTTQERALPAKRKATRQAPARRPPHDNFKLPKPGKSVFAWTKEMEKTFGTTLVDGMARDGRDLGCGDRFADWNEAQVNSICMNVVAYLRGLAAYRGQYDHLSVDSGVGGDKQPRTPQGLTDGSAVPPWEDTKPD